jgi:hypothetical protein
MLTGCETAHSLTDTTHGRAKAAYNIALTDLANTFAKSASHARDGVAHAFRDA